jgi:hypothetical protein
MTTIIDGTAGITFPNSTVQASAGQVLQVVNATYSTFVSTSSSTPSDTGLTASITPRFSTSKILVIVNQVGCRKQSNNTRMGLRVLRGATSIIQFESNGGWTNSTAASGFGGSGASYVDSPATTSATTYKTQFWSIDGTAQVETNVDNATSTITLMEIAG